MKKMTATANRLERLRNLQAKNSPGTPRVILRQQRGDLQQQLRKLHTQVNQLNDDMQEMVSLPAWIKKLRPSASHVWTSKKGKQFKRLHKMPDELYATAINLMVGNKLP